MPMVTFIKVTGRMTKPMALAPLWIQLAHVIKDNGWMINSTEMGKKVGIMGKLNTRVNFLEEKRTVKGSLSGKMAVIMKEILLMGIFKDMESTILRI